MLTKQSLFNFKAKSNHKGLFFKATAVMDVGLS